MRGRPKVIGMCKVGILWLALISVLAAELPAQAQTPEPKAPGATTAAPGKTVEPTAKPDELPAAKSTEPSKATSSKEEASPEKVPAKDDTVPTEAPVTATAVQPDKQPAAEINASTYAVKLRDLEQRINELKEQIFRSKARLSLLAETVLQGVVAGSQAVITHENRMSSSFRLVKAVYALDGAPIFTKADEEGSLGDQEKFDIYHGSMVPGEHTLTVNLEYQGHGFGVFSYLKGYRFKVRSNHTFTAPESKGVSVRVIAYEKGGPTAPLQERPAIRFAERVTSTRRDGAQGPEGRGAE
jgi:hypothetical protein